MKMVFVNKKTHLILIFLIEFFFNVYAQNFKAEREYLDFIAKIDLKRIEVVNIYNGKSGFLVYESTNGRGYEDLIRVGVLYNDIEIMQVFFNKQIIYNSQYDKIIDVESSAGGKFIGWNIKIAEGRISLTMVSEKGVSDPIILIYDSEKEKYTVFRLAPELY